MEGQSRRWRRRARGQSQTLLPLRSTRLSNTISCWYCDIKISSFNEPLYRFGQKHARFLRVWFTVGNGFTLSVLFGVAMMLIWESVASLFLPHGSKMGDFFSSLLFGINPSGSIVKMSLSDIGYLIASTIISVAVHEFGHAIAAAGALLIFAIVGSREGIQLEYIAIFIAALFPGALVAFNYELLQAKPHATALRIYCAGIWHNAVVLDVSSSSPLSSYLAPGDVITSLNKIKINHSPEWMEMAFFLEKQTLASSEAMKGFPSSNGKMHYCAPSYLVQKSERVSFTENQSCPEEHIAFISIPCFHLGEYYIPETRDSGYCISYADVPKLKNCGSIETTADGNCICSENEMCVSPIQMPGIAWAEIAYRKPYSHQCMELEKRTNESTSTLGEENCEKTFLYVGDVISMARSLRLTSFQPRFASMVVAYIPDMLENIFGWTFQVSLTLALLNSLPVYFLDGESILEVCSFHITFLSPRKRRLCLQACLFGGSIISCLVFLKICIFSFW